MKLFICKLVKKRELPEGTEEKTLMILIFWQRAKVVSRPGGGSDTTLLPPLKVDGGQFEECLLLLWWSLAGRLYLTSDSFS